MRRIALALLLIGCRKTAAPPHDLAEPSPAPLPIPSVTVAKAVVPAALFPEDPTLDVVSPASLAFDQETWTGAAEWQQHCHEWGLDPARKDTVMAYLNDALASRGIHYPDKTRAKGIVIAESTHSNGIVVREPLIKVLVCTEGVAPRAGHVAFAERLLEHATLPHADLGPPDVAWQRTHSTGQVEVGFRWQNADPSLADRVVASAGHDEHVSAKLRGKDLWWTSVVR